MMSTWTLALLLRNINNLHYTFKHIPRYERGSGGCSTGSMAREKLLALIDRHRKLLDIEAEASSGKQCLNQAMVVLAKPSITMDGIEPGEVDQASSILNERV